MPGANSLNSKQDASILGYNVDMALNGSAHRICKLYLQPFTYKLNPLGQKTTKHVFHKADAWPFWKAERWCASKSGTLLLEYNEEVKIAAESSGGAPSAGKRYVGLRVDQKSKFILVKVIEGRRPTNTLHNSYKFVKKLAPNRRYCNS